MRLDDYLSDLESRIDDKLEREYTRQWEDFCDEKCAGIFTPHRDYRKPSSIVWPKIMINDALGDPYAMALSEYKGCSDMLANENGCDNLLAVRSNYGTGILSCAFGAEPYIMPYEQNELPISRHFPGGTEDIRRMLAKGTPSLDTGFAGEVFKAGEVFLEAASRYPLVREHVHIYAPDIQGPIDLVELLWGSELYTAFYDEPDLITEALALVTETIIEFRKKWEALCPLYKGKYNIEWAFMHRGGCLIREDSLMNLSGELYREFIMEYDQKVFDALGGGAIHFCGRGDHYIEHVSKLRGLYAVDMSQPDYNDMEKIYSHTVDKNILLLNVDSVTVEKAIRSGHNLNGKVLCRYYA